MISYKPSKSPSDSSSSFNGVGDAEIAGIVICVLLILVFIVLIIRWCVANSDGNTNRQSVIRHYDYKGNKERGGLLIIGSEESSPMFGDDVM